MYRAHVMSSFGSIEPVLVQWKGPCWLALASARKRLIASCSATRE
jgi:hypothetical protein